VLVEPAPTADFYWTPEFGSDENSNLLFLAEDPHATIFRWDFAGMDSSDQRQAYHMFPNAVDGQYEVCLHVADRYGCADSLCQLVDVVIPAVYVPNAFTPDGNGVNDIFRPEVRGMVAEEHELYVFDRWGQVVFSTRDAAQGWDGAHQNGGDILPQGVYNWRLIERPFGSADKKDWYGTITLLK
jgi:gliding motility-associated-like protein